MIVINELEKVLNNKFGDGKTNNFLSNIICKISIPKKERIQTMENILRMCWR